LNRYLKVEKTILTGKDEVMFKAILTKNGHDIYKDSIYTVVFTSKTVVCAKVSGEFIKDWDLKLEALYFMKWMEERK